ncbi:MAG: type I 3-dehydroquinate dehydratase [Clostridia bacterium]|nr:type I 3-dehydroquinate dehydratase [Clostridia bacterium]
MERLSFANAPSPLLIGVVRRRTADEAIRDIEASETNGATAIDLHLSCLEESAQTVGELSRIIRAAKTPTLSLNYNQRYDWESFETTEEERVELLLRSARAGISAVDIQGYTFDLPSKSAFTGDKNAYSFTKNAPREVVTDPRVIQKQVALIEQIHATGAEVLISTHTGIPLTCEQVVELALFLEKRSPDVIKIVGGCTNEEELSEALRAMPILKKEVQTRVHYHVAGPLGRITRLVNPLLGGHMIFCSNEQHVGANKEQLDLKTAVAAVNAAKKLIQQ